MTVSDLDPFADDVLQRLIASNQDYQRSHGHYIVALSERLLAARRENATLREALDLILDMAIARWHEAPEDSTTGLHGWLGLTFQQYGAWVEGGAANLAAALAASPAVEADPGPALSAEPRGWPKHKKAAEEPQP